MMKAGIVSVSIRSRNEVTGMTKKISLSLVCCDPSAGDQSRVVKLEIDASLLTDSLISSADQELPADEAKGLHLAADHEEHGEVTYVQQVNEGGFFVYVGNPDNLVEHWFGRGSYVAFNDNRGSGHASKVGPEGCRRTFRMLKGQIDHSL